LDAKIPLRGPILQANLQIADSRSAAAMAYFDAARRLAGEALPIVMPGDRRNIFDKLFGRRAA
jgi:septum site-determining protein MinD